MNELTKLKTLGELKKAGFSYQSIKQELKKNLKAKIAAKQDAFPGIFGYHETVLPEIERAILSGHNINLLGLRGQAKTRIARSMIGLLDEYIPVVQGSEINDDPFAPVSFYAKNLIAEHGDQTPIEWLHRDERFSEKLATPDVTVADLIGDIDPIKAANLKLSYADHRVIHYGMIPRANRCIFVINELPDLQARIQVALFNILQEGDVQIRGFKLRLELDMQFIFTANPEDYTNRGSIVTPLKDRIGSQILTHYPIDIETAKKITSYETAADTRLEHVYIPELARDLLEQISFSARESEYIDQKSGVSARLSVTAFENLLSTAELRTLRSGENKTTIRLGDFIGVIPAITGKVELVYEGEQEGAAYVAQLILDEAVKSIFTSIFPKIEKLEKPNQPSVYQDVYTWFFNEGEIVLTEDQSDRAYKAELERNPALFQLVDQYAANANKTDRYFIAEVLLWGLAAQKKLAKNRVRNSTTFRDLYANYVSGL